MPERDRSTQASPRREQPSAELSRRRVLAAAAAGALAGAAVGAGAANVFLAAEQATQPRRGSPGGMKGAGAGASLGRRLQRDRSAFDENARRIVKRRRGQGVEEARALRRTYAEPRLGAVAIWPLVERLGACVDATDTGLYGGSQLLHVRQMLAGMEEDGVRDEELILAAFLHDLGKVYLLDGVPAEHVLGRSRRLTDAAPAAGLDALVFQFGHPELAWSRVRDSVPEPVAWMVRYHNIDLDDAEPFLDDRDRQWIERYLRAFRHYDRRLKSPYRLPPLDLARYRDLLESAFPAPLPF